MFKGGRELIYMMAKKSTKMEMEEREEKILELVAQGFSRRQIGERISASYNCTHLAACKQYDKLLKNMKNTSDEEKESIRTVLLQRYEYLYRQALANNQVKSASEIIDKTAKLVGLYEKQSGKEEVPEIFISGRSDLKVVPKDKDAKEK